MSDIKYGHHISYKNYFKIILVYLLVFLPIVFLRFPDVRNEIKYFLISDNMIESGNFFILKYFSELYPDKPPLYFWLLSFLKNHFSADFMQMAVLLGSTLPSFLIVSCTYNLFAKLEDEETGFAAALSLCSIPFFIGTSVFLRMDMLMTFFIFMSLYKFFGIYYGFMEKNFSNLAKIYLCIFLAMLTKGIAGAMVPATTIIVFLILEKNIKFLKEIHFIKGLLFIGVLIGLWIAAVYFQPEGKEYISLMFKQETVGRVVNAKTHVKPIYYYAKMVPLLIFPYGLFFLGSLIYSFKNIKFFKEWSPMEKIGFSWVVVPFVLFSLASGKLDIYLLPIFPGIILMAVSFIFRTKDKEGRFGRAGKIIMQISSALCVIPLLLNKLFNRENNFYKKILFIPTGIIIFFMVISQGIGIYNKEFTLKPVIAKIKEENQNVTAYRFPDFLNCTNMIEKPIEEIQNSEELETKLSELKADEKTVIVGRTKYEKDLKDNSDIKLIYKNKTYCLYIN